jgi:hypothetical protein
VDRSSITHNPTPAIRHTLSMVFTRLRGGGKLIGIDWFSTDDSDANLGESLDPWTRTNIPQGHFGRVGTVHFTDRDHLLELLRGAGFSIERLEHKQVETVVPDGGGRLASWNFVAVKA